MKNYPLLTLPHSDIPILTSEEANKRLDELLAMPLEKVAIYVPDSPSYKQAIERTIEGIIIQKPTVKAIVAVCNYDKTDDVTLHEMAKTIARIRKFHRREDIRVDIFTIPTNDYNEIKEIRDIE